MSTVYRQQFSVTDGCVDCFGRMKPSTLLMFSQQAAGAHCKELAVDYDTLESAHMFWAIIRQRVQVTRLPLLGETITVETWPMPTTRTAYPRSTVAYDEKGQELFRSVSLWVLMDTKSRAMVLPMKSGVTVGGFLRGSELAAPGSLMVRDLPNTQLRQVRYSQLDRNRHMNNTRYLDWVEDLPGSAFHSSHTLAEFTVCYLSEAREGEQIALDWALSEDGVLQVVGHRDVPGGSQQKERVFTAQAAYE